MSNKLNHRRKLARKMSDLKLARKYRHHDEGKEKQERLKRYHKASRKASKLQLSKYVERFKANDEEEEDEPEDV